MEVDGVSSDSEWAWIDRALTSLGRTLFTDFEEREAKRRRLQQSSMRTSFPNNMERTVVLGQEQIQGTLGTVQQIAATQAHMATHVSSTGEGRTLLLRSYAVDAESDRLAEDYPAAQILNKSCNAQASVSTTRNSLTAAEALTAARTNVSECVLIWSDEFNAEGKVDEQKWEIYDVWNEGNVAGNDELQYFTAHEDNVFQTVDDERYSMEHGYDY